MNEFPSAAIVAQLRSAKIISDSLEPEPLSGPADLARLLIDHYPDGCIEIAADDWGADDEVGRYYLALMKTLQRLSHNTQRYLKLQASTDGSSVRLRFSFREQSYDWRFDHAGDGVSEAFLDLYQSLQDEIDGDRLVLLGGTDVPTFARLPAELANQLDHHRGLTSQMPSGPLLDLIREAREDKRPVVRVSSKTFLPRSSVAARTEHRQMSAEELIRALGECVPSPQQTPFQLHEVPDGIATLEDADSIVLSLLNIRKLPPALGQLRRLRRLDLKGNEIRTLPDEMAEMVGLKVLDLAGNALDHVPECIRGMQQLESLVLHGNRIQSLPDWLGELSALQELAVGLNPIKTFPDALCELPSLKELDLRECGLRALPAGIGRLPLEVLKLGGNALRALPEAIGELRTLKSLDLANSRLTAIPESIGGLRALESLNLSKCRLTSLPDSIGTLPRLASLDVSDNDLRSLPETLAPRPDLRVKKEGNPLLVAGAEAIGPDDLYFGLDTQYWKTHDKAWMADRKARWTDIERQLEDAKPSKGIAAIKQYYLKGKMPNWKAMAEHRAGGQHLDLFMLLWLHPSWDPEVLRAVREQFLNSKAIQLDDISRGIRFCVDDGIRARRSEQSWPHPLETEGHSLLLFDLLIWELRDRTIPVANVLRPGASPETYRVPPLEMSMVFEASRMLCTETPQAIQAGQLLHHDRPLQWWSESRASDSPTCMQDTIRRDQMRKALWRIHHFDCERDGDTPRSRFVHKMRHILDEGRFVPELRELWLSIKSGRTTVIKGWET